MTDGSTSWPERVARAYADLLGGEVRLDGVDDGFGPVTVDVPAEKWVDALLVARDRLGCSFFDWLSAVDELEDGLRLVCHVAAHRPGTVDHVAVRTLLPRDDATVASASAVFAGARWHERETHEMFGIAFTDDGAVLQLETLLLPEEFEGHPLRKEFELASRVAKTWPGAKEPGESDEAGPATTSRRRGRPPGVPTQEWGPRPPPDPGEGSRS
jgi:NADH-quinone oxidoreductase subunit C